MTTPIMPAGLAVGAGALNPAPTAASRPSDLHRVATEFEAMLLRQLLSASKMGSGAGGYSDMAVDALANGINQAGGVGLAQQIERVLQGQLGHQVTAPTISHSSFAGSGRSSR